MLRFLLLAHPIVHALPGERLSIYIPCSWPQRAYFPSVIALAGPRHLQPCSATYKIALELEDSKDSRSHIAEANSFRSVDTGLR